MEQVMIFCDFSTQFNERFSAAIDMAGTSKSLVNVIHVINLSLPVKENELPAYSTGWSVLKFLREQAQKEFALLNKRLNHTEVPVAFEVTFRTSLMSAL
ncbi:MAG: hypothetical protein JNJ75_15200 [Cyclobacteriaceae bacterium]|nr:hypothetical protein [Cyclobacteriaceae bacterium]